MKMNSPAALRPSAWRGPARSARWRRRRARRIAAVCCLAVALLTVAGFRSPGSARTHQVAVTARDLPTGTVLTRTDLREISWPRDASVPGALPATQLIGRTLAGGAGAGEPITDARLLDTGTVATGHSKLAVPVIDDASARLARPGQRVDLYDGETDTPIARDIRVVSSLTGDSSTGTHQPTVIVEGPTAAIGGMTRAIARAAAAGTAVRIAVPSDH